MDYTHTLVSEFCNQLAINHRGIRNMHSWYIFSDHRPGTVQARFEADARDYFEYQQLFKV